MKVQSLHGVQSLKFEEKHMAGQPLYILRLVTLNGEHTRNRFPSSSETLWDANTIVKNDYISHLSRAKCYSLNLHVPNTSGARE